MRADFVIEGSENGPKTQFRANADIGFVGVFRVWTYSPTRVGTAIRDV